MDQVETVEVETGDGWVLPLYHYAASGPPVILVHGMAANHYNFDDDVSISLADALVEGGYDVWVVSLRGDPGTQAPKRPSARVQPSGLGREKGSTGRRARRSITFDDYVRYDIDAAIRTVQERTGYDSVAWVGHSLGGMLLYAWLSGHADTVSVGVAVASPAAFPEPPPRPVMDRLISWMPPRGNLPVVALMRSTAWLGRAHPAMGRLANRDNLDPQRMRPLARRAMADIPVPLAHQARSWSQTGEITTVEGDPWISNPGAPVPLLVLGGPLDKVVGEANVAVACERFPDCTYVRLARSDGFSADYGHIDPLLGVVAREEIYPIIEDFLDAHSR